VRKNAASFLYVKCSYREASHDYQPQIFHITKTPYKDSDDPNIITSEKRKLGLVVVRGTQVSLVSPDDGMEEIANPFVAAEE
jgi:hypothetical protein